MGNRLKKMSYRVKTIGKTNTHYELDRFLRPHPQPLSLLRQAQDKLGEGSDRLKYIRKSNNYRYACIFAVLISITSCTSPKSKLAEYGSVFENVMRSDDGVFRGFSLGDTYSIIEKGEKSKELEIDSGYLYYEYKLPTEGSFNITYNFDERGLNEIQAAIFITDTGTVETIFKTFKTYFDEHYGVSQNQMGITAWSVKSKKFGDVKINLSDESTDFTTDKAPGKISLWIYRDKD